MITLAHVDDWAPQIQRLLHKETDRIVAEEAKLAAKRVEERVKELAPTIGARISQRVNEHQFGSNPQLEICVKFWEAGEKL